MFGQTPPPPLPWSSLTAISAYAQGNPYSHSIRHRCKNSFQKRPSRAQRLRKVSWATHQTRPASLSTYEYKRAFFMRRVAFCHDASGYYFYIRPCFILNVKKWARLEHDLVPGLYAEYVASTILSKSRLDAAWRNAPHRMKNVGIRARQPKEMAISRAQQESD